MSLSCSDSASAFFAAWSDALLVAASFSPGVLEGAGGTPGEVSLTAFFSFSSFFFFFSCFAWSSAFVSLVFVIFFVSGDLVGLVALFGLFLSGIVVSCV